MTVERSLSVKTRGNKCQTRGSYGTGDLVCVTVGAKEKPSTGWRFAQGQQCYCRLRDEGLQMRRDDVFAVVRSGGWVEEWRVKVTGGSGRNGGL